MSEATETLVFHPWRGEGPIHFMGDHRYQAWCGARPQFRHKVRPGTPDEVTCPTCLRRLKVGRPQARR